MVNPNEKIVRNGQTLTARVWSLLDSLSEKYGVPMEVGQGGFKGSGGADASSGTHGGGDVFDLRVKLFPEKLWVPVNTDLRRNNGCAWVRSPAYGWTLTGSHIHCVMRDSYYPLSPGAKQQVASYDRGHNGLAGDAADPFPRPVQRPYVMPDPNAPVIPSLVPSEEEMVCTYTDPDTKKTTFWLLHNGVMVNLSSTDAKTFTGPKITISNKVTWTRMQNAYTLAR